MLSNEYIRTANTTKNLRFRYKMSPRAEDPITLTEIEHLAKKKLPSSTYNFYACGADDGLVLKKNTEIFSALVYTEQTP